MSEESPSEIEETPFDPEGMPPHAEFVPESGFTGSTGELVKILENKQRESEEYKNSMLRALADLENYKKRVQRERMEIRNATIAEIIETLLPVLDNFEFGLAAAEQHGSNDVVDGFKMIFANFKNLLATYGLQEIFPLNEKFDVHFHECVRHTLDNQLENDTVSSVERKGYKLNDRLLRPAAVAVSYREEGAGASE